MSETNAAIGKIAIYGAGSIGCYVGGRLLADGNDVTLIGRANIAEILQRDGLVLSHYAGQAETVPANTIHFESEAKALAEADIILLCVKSGDTVDAANAIARYAKATAVLVSLQNGVGNSEILKTALPGHQVLAAMVPFNVARPVPNQFHCATEGDIVLERSVTATGLAQTLSRAGIPVETVGNIEAVQWSKLLLNLNNGVNVLSGLTLKAQLESRHHRLLFADAVSEAQNVLKAAGITPVKFGKVRPQIIPYVLRLPDFLFRIVAAQMLKVDPKAKTSMAEDFANGRQPEIDYLNGAIVELGAKLGVPTPVNAAIVERVKRMFGERMSSLS